MQVSNAVLTVVGGGVFHVIDQGLNVVAGRGGQGQGLRIQPHVVVGLGDATGVAGAAAGVEHLAASIDFAIAEGHLCAGGVCRNRQGLSIPLGRLSRRDNGQTDQHRDKDQKALQGPSQGREHRGHEGKGV